MTAEFISALSAAAVLKSQPVYGFSEAIAVAGFTFSIVFGVMLLIFFLIRIFSAIIKKIESAATKKGPAGAAAATVTTAASEEDFSSGTLKLKDCDEKTAAMIMAIVSDNSGIPLSELVFKSITLKEKN